MSEISLSRDRAVVPRGHTCSEDHMTLQRQTGLILLAACVLFTGAIEVIQRLVIYPGFVTLERTDAATDADRCVESISREVEHLS